jgi:hypothetical protein
MSGLIWMESHFLGPHSFWAGTDGSLQEGVESYGCLLRIRGTNKAIPWETVCLLVPVPLMEIQTSINERSFRPITFSILSTAPKLSQYDVSFCY